MRLALPPSPVLLLPEVGPQDEGIYSCVVTQPNHGPRESPPVSISLGETQPLLQPCPREPVAGKDSTECSSLPHSNMIPWGHPSPPTPRPPMPHPDSTESSPASPFGMKDSTGTPTQHKSSILTHSNFVFQKQERKSRPQVRRWRISKKQAASTSGTGAWLTGRES